MRKEKKRGILLATLGFPREKKEIFSYEMSRIIGAQKTSSKKRFFERRKELKEAKRRAAEMERILEKVPEAFSFSSYVENFSLSLQKRLSFPVIPFFAHIEDSHASFFETINSYEKNDASEEKDTYDWEVFPIYPQYSFSYTGTIARILEKKNPELAKRISWTKSYGYHPLFLQQYKESIKTHMQKLNWKEEETIFLFITKASSKENEKDLGIDLYEKECIHTYKNILKAFPYAMAKILFTPSDLLEEMNQAQTSLIDTKEHIKFLLPKRKNLLIIDLFSLFDSVDTLYRIDKESFYPFEKERISFYRLPSFYLLENSIETIAEIMQEKNFIATHMLH